MIIMAIIIIMVIIIIFIMANGFTCEPQDACPLDPCVLFI